MAHSVLPTDSGSATKLPEEAEVSTSAGVTTALKFIDLPTASEGITAVARDSTVQ